MDTIDVDLKVNMLKGIHTYKKDCKTQITQYTPHGAEVKPHPSFRRKMKEFLNRQNKFNTPYAYQPIEHKILRKARRNIVTLTPTQGRKKLGKPRKITVPKSAITLKRTTTHIPSPTVENQKTINWNAKAAKKRTQNVKEAAQDASIRESLQHVQGKQLVFDFQNPPPPDLDEEVPEEQLHKEEYRGIPYSPSYCPIHTPMGKECNAGQTVSDWDEDEEENSTPKPTALIPPPQQPKHLTEVF